MLWWFCRTSAWIGHRHTGIPSPSLQVGFPVSGIHQTPTGSLFYICNVYVSALFSKIIPPSPSPIVSKSLLFMFQ